MYIINSDCKNTSSESTSDDVRAPCEMCMFYLYFRNERKVE